MPCLVYLLILAVQMCAVVSPFHKRAKGVRQIVLVHIFTTYFMVERPKPTSRLLSIVQTLCPSPMLLHRLAPQGLVIKMYSHVCPSELLLLTKPKMDDGRYF